MPKIIITADDYGMCSEVNRAIDEGIENGIITTTNVMTNMAALSEAADLRERYPRLSIGLHWNVTTGRPVSPPLRCLRWLMKTVSFGVLRYSKKDITRGLLLGRSSKESLMRSTGFSKQAADIPIIGIHMKTVRSALRPSRCFPPLRKSTA